MTGSTNPENHDIYVMRRCVKSWLLEVRARMFEEQQLAQRISETRFRLDGLASKGEGASAGASTDRLSEGMAHLMELEREWSDMVTDDKDFIKCASELCRPKEMARYACWLHWVRGLSWGKVAKRLNYSESKIKHELYDKGVIELYPLIPEEFRRYTLPNAIPK